MKTGVTSSVTGKGRHTTTSRELLFHPAGGMVIDTPGIRELQLWGEIGEVERSFEDVVSLMSQCRFKDCTHNTEPGCAVKRALEDGTLDPERYESYKKQYGEIQRLDKMKRQIEKNFNRAAKRNMSNIRK
jgi:ribosome biogenesis GTPase